MPIRKIEPRDLPAVSDLCIQSFMKAVAASLPEQGVEAFRAIASSASFSVRLAGDNLMFVFEEAGVVQGFVELKEGRHVAMLFVAPEVQRGGVGRQLLAEALRHARVGEVTVGSSLNAVPAYLRYGFVLAGEVAEHAGLIYQPMKIALDASALCAAETAV